MNCIIPGPSVRIFSASIACLSRVGKDLYLDFDPLDGLKLSALNDAKSAFGEVHFEPSFFTQCSGGGGISGGGMDSNYNQRVLRQKRTRAQRQRQRGNNSDEDDDDDDDAEQKDNNDDDSATTATTNSATNNRFTCRVPFRAMSAVIRSRRNVSSLRLRKEISSSKHVYLSFAFELFILDDDDELNNNNNRGEVNHRHAANNHRQAAADAVLHVVHRMGVVDDVNTMAAVLSRDGSSEIVASPKVLLRMLEPLKQQTHQVSFTVHDVNKTLTATSFYHPSTSNAVLQATAAKLIQTETCIGCDELDDFHFRDDRGHHQDNEQGDSLPENVNQQVTLVFGIKEAKAMLTFCSTVSSSSSTLLSHNNNSYHRLEQQQSSPPELKVSMSFHWGGKPIVLETAGNSFSAKMVLATLDHKVAVGQQQQQQQQQSGGGGRITSAARHQHDHARTATSVRRGEEDEDEDDDGRG